VLQNSVGQPLERPVIDDAQHAERAVVHLISRQVAAEGLEGFFQAFAVDALRTFFPPPPRPSSGSWRKARKPGDPATGANWLPDRASCPPRPTAPLSAGRDGCIGTWAGPGRPYQR
jgi:hypothetical protein